MKEIFFIFAGMFTFCFILVFALVQELDRPDVLFDARTGKCISVTFANGTNGSCDNIPKEYNYYSK